MHVHTENKFKCMVTFLKVLLMPFSKKKKKLYQDSRFHLAVPLKSKDILKITYASTMEIHNEMLMPKIDVLISNA